MAIQPYHDRDGFIWQDGALVPWREAAARSQPRAALCLCCLRGRACLWRRHLQAYRALAAIGGSARLLGFELPCSVDDVDRACDEALRANGIKDGYVRPIAWRGSEMMGVSAQEPEFTLPSPRGTGALISARMRT